MDTGRDDGDRRFRGVSNDARTLVVTITVAILLALSLTAPAIVGTVTAIDQVAILSPDRTQVEAAPGETIELDVILRSQGGHGGEGVKAVTLIAQYHPKYLEITDVSRGPWLEGENTRIAQTETIAHERGTAILEQRRKPAAGGTTGAGTVAALTVRVADDAPAGTTTISFDESNVSLTGDWPIAVVDESATVAIDGGNESLGSFDHPDPARIDRESSRSNPADTSSDSGADAGEADGDGPIPGFTVGLAFGAIALVMLRLAAGRDGHR